MQSNYSIYIHLQYCKWKRYRKGKFKGRSKLKRKKGSGRWFISLIISEKHCRITSIISPSWMVSETKTQNIEVFNIFHYICILPISTFAKWFLTKLVGVFMIDFGHDKQSSSCCFCFVSRDIVCSLPFPTMQR